MPFHLHLHQSNHISWVPETSSPAAGYPSQHKFDRRLQKGSEGVVEQWTHQPTGTVLAVKIVRSRKSIPVEVQLLQGLPPHDSIVECLGYYEKQPSPDKSSIVLEYCSEGDLFGVRGRNIKENNGIFSEAFMWSVYSQLVSALAFLHDGIDIQNPLGRDNWRPVVHRDIKVENILVKSLGSKDDWSDIDLKLGDFGMAGYYDPANPNPTRAIGTTTSWPPEVTWETRRLSPASDVWGAAAIIHELAHRFEPLVSIEIAIREWLKENNEAPYPDTWDRTIRMNYWGAKTLRRVIPINLDPEAPLPPDLRLDKPDERVEKIRKHRPSPKYSNALNGCMLMGLEMDPHERASAGELLSHIEEAHAEVLFQELSVEHERETTPSLDQSDNEQDDKYSLYRF